MNPDNNNGSGTPVTPPAGQPAAPAVPSAEAPQTPQTPPVTPPAAPATPPPAETPPVAPQAPAGSAEPAAPAAPAAPEQPRESAQMRRAREAREKANGLNQLANRLDPQPAAPAAPVAPPAPPVQAPAAPIIPTAPSQPAPPDYIDDDGNFDPAKHAAWVAAEVQRGTQAALAADRAAQQQESNRRAIVAEVQKYAGSVEADANYLSTSVDELNPNSDKYNPALDDYIESAYKQATTDSQGNIIRTDISLRQFAEQQVNLARQMGVAAAAAAPNSVAGQATDTAVTPGQPTPPPTKIEDLPIEERIKARREKLGYARVQTPPPKTP